jgi:hypothetical protein
MSTKRETTIDGFSGFWCNHSTHMKGKTHMKTATFTAGFAGILALALTAITTQAAVLVNFENDNVVGTDLTTPADFVDADLTSTVLTQGIGSAGGWTDALAGIQNSAAINSLSAAITANDYFSFSVTSDALREISCSSLFMRYSVGANVRPAQTTFTLLSSLTGFTSADGLGTIIAALPVDASVVGTGTFDLTGVTALQNIAAETSVQFRIYAHNTGANPMTRIGIGHLFFNNGTDDLTLNGTITVVPEPGAMAMLLGGLGMLTLFRRKVAGQ